MSVYLRDNSDDNADLDPVLEGITNTRDSGDARNDGNKNEDTDQHIIDLVPDFLKEGFPSGACLKLSI